MNREILHSITEDDINNYNADGAVCIRQQFDQEWLDHMLEVCERHISEPSGSARRTQNVNDPGQVITGSFMAHENPIYMDFARHSPAREIAARLMKLDEVRFFYDQIFIKEPGTQTPTAWHHDLPFWPFAGNHVASVWLALTPVTTENSGLVYVSGSHRWGKMYLPVPAVPIPNFVLDEASEFEDCPMFHKEFKNPDYKFLSWDMEPGDCIVHHPLTVHGAGANTSLEQRRVALSTRYFGGDATWYGPRTTFSPPYTENEEGLVRGELPTNDKAFPVVWRNL
ncbi:phytanoyl-CoA dioxygenase family protein [Gammaproteobacteria bacterium]|nr:phytanoyl-CoA dioxygenase family protein [Gammaproteobacteria bacterium]